MNVAWTLLWKDLATEWRCRDRLFARIGVSGLGVVGFQAEPSPWNSRTTP